MGQKFACGNVIDLAVGRHYRRGIWGYRISLDNDLVMPIAGAITKTRLPEFCWYSGQTGKRLAGAC